jgi:hypothetical protein
VFINLHFNYIGFRASVVLPDMRLLKAYPIQHTFWKAIEAIGELFRIWKYAANTLNFASFPSDIIGRSAVPRGMALFNDNMIANVELMGRNAIDWLGSFHGGVPFLRGDSNSSGTLNRARI